MNLAQVRGILTCLLFALSWPAQAQERYVEGVHYTRIEDPSAAYDLGAADGQPSLLEVFWYGCGHCYAFDPLLDAWVEEKGDSVAFARSPMVWDTNTKSHARLFFTTQELGLHAKMHTRIFDEIHKKGNFLLDATSVAALFEDYGVAADTVAKTAESFAVDAAVRKTEARQRELVIPSVPALIVNGTWLINNREVPTHQGMLDVADFLLDKKP